MSTPPPKKSNSRAGARPGDPTGPRAQNRRRRIQSICKSALDLFVAQGIEAVTIDAITRGAGISKGNFYRYFDDKAALVDALFTPASDKIQDRFDVCEAALGAAKTLEDLNTAYQALGQNLFALFVQYRDIVRVFLHSARGPSIPGDASEALRQFDRKLQDGATRMTAAAHTHGLLRPEIPPGITALAVIGAIERLARAWLAGDAIGPPLDAVRALVSLITEGIRAVPAPAEAQK